MAAHPMKRQKREGTKYFIVFLPCVEMLNIVACVLTEAFRNSFLPAQDGLPGRCCGILYGRRNPNAIDQIDEDAVEEVLSWRFPRDQKRAGYEDQ
jgi:hypothetical protein